MYVNAKHINCCLGAPKTNCRWTQNVLSFGVGGLNFFQAETFVPNQLKAVLGNFSPQLVSMCAIRKTGANCSVQVVPCNSI